MPARFQSYPTYKPSGVEWLGDVPAHWEIQRGKKILQPVDIRSQTGEEELLTVSSERGVVPRKSANVTMFQAESYVGYKLCWPGDLVINSLWAWAQGLGVSPHHGIVSSAYGVYRFSPSCEASPQFIHYLVRSIPFQWELQVRSKGIWVSRLQLTDEAFLRAPFPLPPLADQNAIVCYLDYVDRRIQRYIEAKEQLIALLQEARQSLIQRAVTRGLDPDVPLKPSGIDWLGDVPAHWEVRRAKFLYREVNERSNTGTEELMSVSHKTGVTPRKKNVTMFRAETNVGYKLCRPGDIVINTMWAYMAALGVARQVGLVSPSYNVYRSIDAERMNPDYIDPLLRTETYRTEYLVRSTGITVSRLRLYPESFLDIPLLYPPVEEQAAIAAHLDQATAAIDAAIDNARRQSERMAEYRASLIAHVVTGKLDVRAAAEPLPQKARELTIS